MPKMMMTMTVCYEAANTTVAAAGDDDYHEDVYKFWKAGEYGFDFKYDTNVATMMSDVRTRRTHYFKDNTFYFFSNDA